MKNLKKVRPAGSQDMRAYNFANLSQTFDIDSTSNKY